MTNDDHRSYWMRVIKEAKAGGDFLVAHESDHHKSQHWRGFPNLTEAIDYAKSMSSGCQNNWIVFKCDDPADYLDRFEAATKVLARAYFVPSSVRVSLGPDRINLQDEDPLEMRLCESERLVLKPNALYRFSADESCERCIELSKSSKV